MGNPAGGGPSTHYADGDTPEFVEHWDVMQEEVPVSATASGNPMFTPA
jgi:hypothetical protein